MALLCSLWKQELLIPPFPLPWHRSGAVQVSFSPALCPGCALIPPCRLGLEQLRAFSWPSAVLIFCHHIGASRAVLSLQAKLTSDVCLASLSVAQLDPAQQHPPHSHPLILICQRSGPRLWEAKRAGKNQLLILARPWHGQVPEGAMWGQRCCPLARGGLSLTSQTSE